MRHLSLRASALFVLVLMTFMFAAQLPVVLSDVPTAQDKALTLITDVFGLDVETQAVDLTLYNEKFVGGIQKEIVKYNLGTGEQQGTIRIDFENNRLFLSRVRGTDIPIMNSHQTGNTLESAKIILERYQAYLGDSSLQEMIDLFNEVSTLENATLRVGNIKLEVKSTPRYTNFYWKHTFNDVDYNEINIVFDGNGLILADMQSRYKMGGTDVNISKEQAIEIAIKFVENYGYPGITRARARVWISGFNISRERTTADLGASDRDNLRYPCWGVDVMLDALYPGNVYGFGIGIWADSGEIFAVSHEAVGVDFPIDYAPSDYPPIDESDSELIEQLPKSKENNATPSDSNLIVAGVTAAILISVVTVALFLKKRSR